jgi:acyl carrier protein
VRDRLGEILGLDDREVDATVVRTASLVAVLGGDDMSRIELAEALEDELGERTVGFSIDDEDLAELETIADLVDYVLSRLETPGPERPSERGAGPERPPERGEQ